MEMTARNFPLTVKILTRRALSRALKVISH